MITQLQDELSGWVEEQLTKCKPCKARDRKIIRDAVHGFILIEPYEVEILDCFLLQRLRYIHQTAFAYLVYPCANHSRFEHSLGVMQTAQQMLTGIEQAKREVFPGKTRREVRLAALVHDISHTFLSHIGESIIKDNFGDLFRQIKGGQYEGHKHFFKGANEGEILAYLIITCDPFVKFISTVCSHYSETAKEPYDLERVAGFIIGHTENTEERYLGEIINGPLDADKLDYLVRDCYFSGIRGEVDVPRIMYTLDTIDRQSGGCSYCHLTVKGAALAYLEQILLTKVTLHTAIYHHHKIRALECLMKGLFEVIRDCSAEISNPHLKFQTIPDYLRVSEYQFLTWGIEDKVTNSIVSRILTRNLPKRALVLSKPTVEEWTEALSALSSNIPDQAELHRYRDEIFKGLGSPNNKWGIELLWIDNPQGPRIQEEASHCYIDLGSGKPETLSSLMPSADWLRSYVTNKMRAHVFYDEDPDARKQAASLASILFKEEFDIVVKPEALTLSHLED